MQAEDRSTSAKALSSKVILLRPRVSTHPNTPAEVRAAKSGARPYRYAMVLHTDQQHPHVHMVVKAEAEEGQRLHIDKEMLRTWRKDFAQLMRDQGIAANATRRVARDRRLALLRLDGYGDFMKRVEIQLPDEIFAALELGSAELAAEFRVAAAAKWYEVGRVSQGTAAQIAGVSRGEFLTILSRLHVSPMQESTEEALAGAFWLLKKQ